MLTLAEAEEIAQKHIPGFVARGPPVDLKTGWYFPRCEIGSLGFVVDKETGYTLDFGSGLDEGTWIWAYEKGFRWNSYDLIVTRIRDFGATVDFLGKCLFYPGVAHHPQRDFPDEELIDRLSHLPARFANQSNWLRIDKFREVDNEGPFSFEVTADSHATTPETATRIDIDALVLCQLGKARALHDGLLRLIDARVLDIVITDDDFHAAYDQLWQAFEVALRSKAREGLRGKAWASEARKIAPNPTSLYKVPCRIIGNRDDPTSTNGLRDAVLKFHSLDDLLRWIASMGWELPPSES